MLAGAHERWVGALGAATELAYRKEKPLAVWAGRQQGRRQEAGEEPGWQRPRARQMLREEGTPLSGLAPTEPF